MREPRLGDEVVVTKQDVEHHGFLVSTPGGSRWENFTALMCWDGSYRLWPNERIEIAPASIPETDT